MIASPYSARARRKIENEKLKYSTVRARLLGETLRRQVVRVAPRRRFTDLQQPLLDATLQIRVDQSECDAQFGSEMALRLAAITFHGFEEIQHDPRFMHPLTFAATNHRPDQPFQTLFKP